MPGRRPLAILILAVALAGCTTTVSPAQPAPTRSPVTPRARRVAHRTPGPASPDITLAFAGDVNFASRTARLLRHPASAFGPVSAVLGPADFTAVNLETAVATQDEARARRAARDYARLRSCTGPVLTFAAPEWQSFISGIKAGQPSR
jgi:hypothetical protein